MSRVAEVLNKVTVYPRRSWKFWAAIAAVGVVLILGTAFKVILDSKGDVVVENRALKQQLEEVKAIGEDSNLRQECRSRASIFVAEQRAVADTLLNRGLTAFAAGKDITPYALALDAANDNVDRSLEAQKIAIDRCATDPSFEISATILALVPTIPGGTP